MKARFEELADVSDKAVSEIGKSLNEKLSSGFAAGGEREYLETIRRLQPELKQLHQNIKDGALDLTDYHRRMQMLDPATRSAIAAANQLGSAFRKTGDEAEHGTNGLGNLLIKLDLLGRATNFIQQKFGEATQEFLQFGRNIANIGSIADDGFDLSKVKEDLMALPPEFGHASDEARGFYQALSSGVAAADALQFTKDSAIAAKAGLTDLFTTVDASTTVLNSYGIAASNVTNVYDLMFETVKRGKIEFPQLASYIGNVSNISAQAGISIQEMFAVIATATATTKPAIAVDAFRSAITGILKPSEEATKLAEQLGLQFDVAAVRAKGFSGFLADVMEKTHGNIESLATLFGNVEGLNSILSITGAQSNNFTQSIEAMKQAFGSADPTLNAFNKQQESLGAQMDASGVLIEKGFLKVFGLIEPTLIAVLLVINKYPVPFGVAAAAVGALTVAHLLLNTQLVATAVTSIPALIRGLMQTIATMISLEATMAAGATGIVAFTAGWGLLAIAVLGGLYALSQYSQAQAKTAEEHQKGIDAIKGQADALNQQRQSLSSLQGDVSHLTLEQGKLAEIYNTLDSTSKAHVNNLIHEKGAVGALADELERLNKANLSEVQTRLTLLANHAFDAFNKFKQAKEEADKAEAAITQARTPGLSDKVIYHHTGEGAIVSEVVTATQQFEQLQQQQEKTSAASRTAEASFNTYKNTLQTGIGVFNQLNGNSQTTIDQFIKQQELTKELAPTSDAFRKSLFGVGDAQNTLANGMNKTNGVIDEQTNKIKALRDQLKELISATRAKIDEKIADIVLHTTDKAAAAARAKDAMQHDDQLKDLLKENTRLKDSQESVEKTFGLVTEHVKKARTSDLADAKKYVRGMKAELGDLQNVLDAMRKGTMGQESGGRQAVVNGRTGASGLFQVMPANVGNWTKEYVGKVLSVTQFKKDVDAQVTVFNGEMGKYLQTAMKRSGGDVKKAIRMAAAAWYGGEGAMMRFDDPTIFRKGEPSFRTYTSSVLQQTLTAAGGRQSSTIKEFDAEAQTLREIAETRARINQLINEGGDANKKQLDGLHDYENNLQQIAKLVEQINSSGLKEHLVIGLPDTPADAQKMVERLQTFTQLQNSLRSQTESAKEHLFEVTAEMNGGLTPLEKFDHSLQVLRESGKLTAADFVLLADDIKAFREELIRTAQIEYAKKLSDEAKSAGDAFKQMSDSFRQELVEKSPINEFLHSIEQVKELKLDSGNLNQVKDIFAVGNEVDTEKFAAYVRQWLTFLSAMGGFDATKIDDVVNKLQDAASGFNSATQHKTDTDFDSIKKDLGGQLEELQRGGRELTEYERTLRQINTDYKDLDPTQKQYLLNMAAEIDAQREFKQTYQEIHSVVRDSLQTFVDEGWGGLFKSIRNRFKTMLLDMAADLITSKFMKVLTGQSNTSNAPSGNGGGGFLGKLIGWLGGGKSSGAATTGGYAGGNPAAAILGDLTGAGGASGLSMFGGGRPAANQFASREVLAMLGGGSGGNLSILPSETLSGQNAQQSQAKAVIDSVQKGLPKGATGWLQKNIFGGSEKGMQGALMGGSLGLSLGMSLGQGSTLGKILGGAGGAVTGGILGTLLMAGGALSLTPVGWALLAAGGLAMVAGALFGRSGQRKKDEKARTQYITDAFAQIDELTHQVKIHRLDGGQALTQAAQIRAQYLQQSGALKDKKTRNIALKDVSRLDDPHIKALRDAATKAANESAIAQRFSPEFANGGVVGNLSSSEMQRILSMRRGYDDPAMQLIKVKPGEKFLPPHEHAKLLAEGGMIPGMDKGRDDTFMLAPTGSLILNKAQQARVPQFENGGTVGESSIGRTQKSGTSSSFSFEPQVNVTVSIGKQEISEAVVEVMDSETGRKVTKRNLIVLSTDRRI